MSTASASISRVSLATWPAVPESDLIFRAIADAVPDIALSGAPRRLRSAWLNGVKELRVSYG